MRAPVVMGGWAMWRPQVDHKGGDTQGNFHFMVLFNGSVFSPCNVAIKVD